MGGDRGKERNTVILTARKSADCSPGPGWPLRHRINSQHISRVGLLLFLPQRCAPGLRNEMEERGVTPWVQAERALSQAGGARPRAPCSCLLRGDPEAGLPSVSGAPCRVPGSVSLTGSWEVDVEG